MTALRHDDYESSSWRGPLSAPPPAAQEIRIPTTVGDAYSDLHVALLEHVGLPVAADWGFRCDDPTGGFNRYGWNATDQAHLDAVWPTEADALANELIDLYGTLWPWVFARQIASRAADFAAVVLGLAEQALVGQGHTYRNRKEVVFDLAMMYGAFDHVRARRTWPAESARRCAICGRLFPPEALSHWMHRQFGPPRYCAPCCMRAYGGRRHLDEEAALRGLRRLASAFGAIPPQAVGSHIAIGALEPDRRDLLMAAMVAGAAPERYRELFGQAWIDSLKAAELNDETWRPARGTYCRARDGHLCRSIGERSIDDFLHMHGITHECEPAWPPHRTLNERGRRRADWVLPDGTFVEYAGLTDKNYLDKMIEKRALAEAVGISLVVVQPEDLVNLAAVFAKWISVG